MYVGRLVGVLVGATTVAVLTIIPLGGTRCKSHADNPARANARTKAILATLLAGITLPAQLPLGNGLVYPSANDL